MALLDIPYPPVERSGSPLDTLRPDEATRLAEFFYGHPHWRDGILSTHGLAWMYHAVRVSRPTHIVEIGTYKGWTAQVLAYAAHANGEGIVHTVGPYDEERFAPLLEQWPTELRQRLRFYPMNSMAFFQTAYHQGTQFGLVLVDGAHDYEFALFDIQCAARSLAGGGLIFVDNISQAGPYQAAADFCAHHPDWRNWGLSAIPSTRAYEPGRSTLVGTDFAVIQAPNHESIGRRPRAVFHQPWPAPALKGLSFLPAAEHGRGTIYLHCALRGFSQHQQQEIFAEAQMTVQDGPPEHQVCFDIPMQVDVAEHYSVEAFAHWDGPQPMRLRSPPIPL
jgi:predicted O-methyltransferase YrrM